MSRDAYIPLFQNHCLHFLLLLFFKEYLNSHSRIKKMVNKRIVNYHSSPLDLNLRIHSLIFLWIPKGFISPVYFLNFFWNLYVPPWKSFKFIVLRLLKKKNICDSTNWTCSFLHVPSNETLPQILIIITPQGERN